MKTFEKIASLLALIGTILRLMLVHSGNAIFAYSILALSLMYFFLGFAFFNDIQLRSIFKRSAYAALPRYHVAGGVFTGIALFFACMGILFKLLWWPGALFELAAGIAFCFIILFISFIKKTAKHTQFYQQITTRTMIFFCVCIVLFYLPQIAIFEMEYRNHPEYIKAMEEFQKDPSNQQLKDKMLNEERRAK